MSSSTKPASQHSNHIGSQRLIRPNGRKVYTVNSPEAAENIRQTLSTSELDHFDIVIYGSPEHVGDARPSKYA
jgi:hypothetical protein